MYCWKKKKLSSPLFFLDIAKGVVVASCGRNMNMGSERKRGNKSKSMILLCCSMSTFYLCIVYLYQPQLKVATTLYSCFR